MSQGLSLESAETADQWLTRDVWPRRVIAFVIDMIVISIMAATIAWTIFLFGVLTLGFGFVALHLLPLIPPLYYVFALCSRAAATPGQRLLGISVRRNTSLMPPNLAEALTWTLLFGLSMALSFLPLLLVLVTRRHRAAHDILSGLVVVHRAAIPGRGF
jgi:uncharacterized RDD family membrane protein YckC